MAWTSPRTFVANVTALTAAVFNTDLRDNLNYLKGLLDGTGSGAVRVPANLHVWNQDYAWVGQTSTSDRYGMNVDNGDWWDYDRTANTFRWISGSALALTLAATGKLTGLGFYDSGATAIGTSTTIDMAHGLGARPRYIHGYWTTSGAAALDETSATNVNTLEDVGGGTNVCYVQWAGNTNIRVGNSAASGTTHFRVYAML